MPGGKELKIRESLNRNVLLPTYSKPGTWKT